MKKLVFFGTMLLAVSLLFVGCADASTYVITDNASHTYGFWGGVWHGMIMFPDFIGSLIWDDVAVYAVNNNGAWYDFGFVGGFSIILKVIGHLLKALLTSLANGK